MTHGLIKYKVASYITLKSQYFTILGTFFKEYGSGLVENAACTVKLEMAPKGQADKISELLGARFFFLKSF